jgi:histone deacetylase complex regulatory component SIN3
MSAPGGGPPRPDPQAGHRELKVEDALLYLDEVRKVPS